MTRLGLIVLIVGLAVGWVIQLYLTYLQSRRFSDTVAELRRSGRAAVGKSGSIYRGIVYCALAADDSGTVVGAQVLRGVTVFARPRAAPDLVGRSLDELVEEPDSPVERAAAQAAAALMGDTAAPEGGEAKDRAG